MLREEIIRKVARALVEASSIMQPGQVAAYRKAVREENNPHAKWALEQYLENASQAAQSACALCDDTGIPHLILDLGPKMALEAGLIEAINQGIAQGLAQLPGRPMAVLGDDLQRIEQKEGLDADPAALLPAPMLVRRVEEDVLRLNLVMLGGGPEIRGSTQHIAHKHDWQVVEDEIVRRAREAVAKLGCTPCSLAVGIGRSLYEASALSLEALVDGAYDRQSPMEEAITARVNQAGIGPLGLGGKTTLLATFMKIGPQRASGVRIVAIRPACCVEPRIARVLLDGVDHEG